MVWISGGSNTRSRTRTTRSNSALRRPGAEMIRRNRGRVCGGGFRTPSDDNFQSVVSGGDLELAVGDAQFGVAAGLVEDGLEREVVAHRFVMVHHEMLDARHVGKLDGDNIARMTPILLGRGLLRERVLGVEYQHVGGAESVDHRVAWFQRLILVLGIGGINDNLVLARKAISVGVVGMILRERQHRQTRDIVAAPGLQLDKIDGRANRLEVNREARRRLLADENFAHRFVAAINPNQVSGNIGRGEKRKAVDVIPVKMGQEDIEDRSSLRAALDQDAAAELTQPASEIAQHELFAAGCELDTAGISAEAAANREREVVLDEDRK